jgi:hypothetical protein
MSIRIARLIVLLTAVGCVTSAPAAQGQGYGSPAPSSSKSDATALRPAVDAANRRFENAFNSGDGAGGAGDV